MQPDPRVFPVGKAGAHDPGTVPGGSVASISDFSMPISNVLRLRIAVGLTWFESQVSDFRNWVFFDDKSYSKQWRFEFEHSEVSSMDS